MNINKKISKILQDEFVNYIGFADLRTYQEEVINFGGKIVQEYKYGISIGIVLPNAIVNYLPNRFDQNIACEYKTHAYNVINSRLDICASKVASYLNSIGYRTLPIAVAERTNILEAIPTISHKMVAHIAGLGWIGKNCLLITPEHGPRVRFVTVLTNAPIKAINKPLQQRCNDCTECAKICPAKAIKGKNYLDGEHREERFDFKKCQDYFKRLKEKYTWDVCGMCLYVCPYGNTDEKSEDF